MTPDGIITTVAGTGERGGDGEGDGLPAVDAPLDGPRWIAVTPSGALLIIEDRECVRVVNPDGIITSLALDPIVDR